MKSALKILLLEDSAYDAEMIQRCLLKGENRCYEFKLVMNEEEFLASLDQFEPDIILSDNSLPQFSAAEALKLIRERSSYIPFILVTGKVPDEFAVAIIRQGADDYILKDRLNRLGMAIDVALKKTQAEKERLEAINELHKSNERYITVTRATSDTIWDWDLVSDTITRNGNLRDIFGYRDLDLITTNQWWMDRIHPADVEGIHKNVIEQIHDKTLRFEDEYRFLCADGSYKYVYDRAFLVLDPNGKPVRMIGAMQDVTERKLHDRKITKAIIGAQDQERYQLGGELHDNVTQILAGTLLSLNMMKKNPGSSETPALIKRCHEYILMAIDEIRQLSHKLAPAIEKPLKETFEQLIHNMNVDNTYHVSLVVDSFEDADISNDIKLNLYRILQEQFNNITKYSGATSIDIWVSVEKRNVKMRIHDNGKGFDTKAARKGIGLANIQKRTELFSGSFLLQSSVGNGCSLTVDIPLRDSK
jgi:two-component system, NarL family, sensor histidine kinase UhpB